MQKKVDILVFKNQALQMLYNIVIPYTIKHLRGKLSQFINNIHYVGKTFAVCPCLHNYFSVLIMKQENI